MIDASIAQSKGEILSTYLIRSPYVLKTGQRSRFEFVKVQSVSCRISGVKSGSLQLKTMFVWNEKTFGNLTLLTLQASLSLLTLLTLFNKPLIYSLTY